MHNHISLFFLIQVIWQHYRWWKLGTLFILQDVWNCGLYSLRCSEIMLESGRICTVCCQTVSRFVWTNIQCPCLSHHHPFTIYGTSVYQHGRMVEVALCWVCPVHILFDWHSIHSHGLVYDPVYRWFYSHTSHPWNQGWCRHWRFITWHTRNLWFLSISAPWNNWKEFFSPHLWHPLCTIGSNLFLLVEMLHFCQETKEKGLQMARFWLEENLHYTVSTAPGRYPLHTDWCTSYAHMACPIFGQISEKVKAWW